MVNFAILLVFAIHLTNGQLNYEGNPLTEFTEYTAEESNLSERTAREKDTPIDISNSYAQKLYPVPEPEGDKFHQRSTVTDNLLLDKSQRRFSVPVQDPRSDNTARQFQTPLEQNPSIDSAETALNTFLNSRTPEESRASLDYYLRSQQSPDDQSQSPGAIAGQDKTLERFEAQQQPVFRTEQRQSSLPQLDQQVQLTAQGSHNQLASVSQLIPQIDHRQQLMPSVVQGYGYPAGQPIVIQPATGIPVRPGMVPLMPGLQARNDVITPAMWRQRMRRIRGKPFSFAQARIAPGLYKGPVAVPFKHQGPVEVIYTKMPGLHRGPPVLSNPPMPYEDASAWFPDAEHPPPAKDIYYSQLYAQSYDPHYYNYIAATGKIRPHLYGKLFKHKEEQSDGIWSELYRGFTKHGLKNIMTPTFLLGMTLPVVTLMLSALVQKRSIARMDARELDQEEVLQEYLERLQRAMECYTDKDTRNAKDKC